jgi:hypothetical protein
MPWMARLRNMRDAPNTQWAIAWSGLIFERLTRAEAESYTDVIMGLATGERPVTK